MFRSLSLDIQPPKVRYIQQVAPPKMYQGRNEQTQSPKDSKNLFQWFFHL